MSACSQIDARTAEIIRSAIAVARAGRVREACDIGERGLAVGGNPAALHAMIGSLLCWDREFDASIPHLKFASEARPSDPIVTKALATALVGCGRFSDALAVLSKAAVAADPGCDLLRLRGYAAQMVGDPATATEAYERVVATEPGDWEAWNNLGSAKVSAKDLTGGIAALRRATDLNPRAAPARLNLARALRQANLLVEAAAELQLIAVDFVEESAPLVELADLLHARGHDARAELALESAVAREPRNADLLVALGRQQLITFTVEKAEETFRRALELQPNHADAFLGLADALEHRCPEALADLTVRAEKVKIASAPLALLKARTARRERRYEAGIEVLRRVPDDFEPESRWQLEGQLLDGAGRYDKAFAAFRRMNAAHAADPSEPLLRAAELRDKLREQLQHTTRAWQAGWTAPLTPAVDAPVFLLGFPRSGTTLLDTMLMGHPQVQVMEERPVLARLEAEIGGFNAIAALTEERLRHARTRYFEVAAEYIELRPGAVLIDKSPLHLQRLPQIVRLFPNAKFILALRHPADVILSCFMSNFRLNSSTANFLQLDTAAEFYDLSFMMWENALSLFPVEAHSVAYERLVEDPRAVLKPAVEALGLTWHPEIVDHQRTAEARGIITTASYAQVTQPLYRGAVGRWRRYRKHIEPALATLAPWIQKFGYEL